MKFTTIILASLLLSTNSVAQETNINAKDVRECRRLSKSITKIGNKIKKIEGNAYTKEISLANSKREVNLSLLKQKLTSYNSLSTKFCSNISTKSPRNENSNAVNISNASCKRFQDRINTLETSINSQRNGKRKTYIQKKLDRLNSKLETCQAK